MSLEDGWAAFNLDMPPRVPRTEYSVERHWALVSRVTGLRVHARSAPDEQQAASNAFMRAWNYDFRWSTDVGATDLGEWQTRMGHAVYASEGTDFDTDIRSPFASPEDALAFHPLDQLPSHSHHDLVTRFNQQYRQRCAETPELVNVVGTYITLFSGFIALFGWDHLLMAMGYDPQRFGVLANEYADWMMPYFYALADCAAPIIMVHDDIVWSAGAIMSPAWYRAYLFPNYRRYFAPLIEAGKKIVFTSDGDYTQFVDDLADCGAHGFVLEPLTDMVYIAERYGNTHVFIGNADTRVLLTGTRDSIRQEVNRCMAIGKPYPGFFMAVGNHIPPNTPVENALYYNQVYMELSER
jgi:uroporphyrinogen-III decarboxylase